MLRKFRKNNTKLIIVYDNGEPYHVNNVESWWVDSDRNITYRKKLDENVTEEYTSKFGDVSVVITKVSEPSFVENSNETIITTVYNFNHKNISSTLEFFRVGE